MAKLSNCVLFALGQWWAYGGYLVVRKSYFGWWPHFLWSQDLVTFEEYTPYDTRRRKWLPPLLFKGYVRRGEPPEIE